VPRIVEKRAATAKRIEEAIAAILGGAPKSPVLRNRANKGTLKLNFATVEIEAGVKRHLFDDQDSVYSEQYAAIAAQMPAKGKSEPLAKQLEKSRKELQITKEQLQRSQTYAAHLLTQSHQLELEISRLGEEIATLAGGADEPLVGSGRLIGLPPPPRKTRRKRQNA
jgi:hypothetical protein